MKYKVGDWVEIDNPSVYSRNPDVIIRGVITGGYDRKDSSNLYFIDCIAVNGRLHMKVYEKYITLLPEKDAMLCKLGHTYKLGN